MKQKREKEILQVLRNSYTSVVPHQGSVEITVQTRTTGWSPSQVRSPFRLPACKRVFRDSFMVPHTTFPEWKLRSPNTQIVIHSLPVSLLGCGWAQPSVQLQLPHLPDDSRRHTHAQEKTQYSPAQDDPSTLQTQVLSSPATRTPSMPEQPHHWLNSGQPTAHDGSGRGMIPVLFRQVQLGPFLYRSMDS